MRFAILLAAFMAIFASAAEAQSFKRCKQLVKQIEDTSIAGASPFAAVDKRGALSHDCQLITLFALEPKWSDDPKKRTLYFARRWYAVLDNPPEIRYADGRTCPGVAKALKALSSFELPRIVVPPERPSDRVMVTADGAYYGLWTNRLANSDDKAGISFMDISLGDWNNDALERLFDSIAAALEKCWQETEPAKPA